MLIVAGNYYIANGAIVRVTEVHPSNSFLFYVNEEEAKGNNLYVPVMCSTRVFYKNFTAYHQHTKDDISKIITALEIK